MKKLLPGFGFILIVLLSGCSGGGSSQSEKSFVAGRGVVTLIDMQDRKVAPKLSGMTLTGRSYEYKVGKIGIVNVWASWCSPCRAEAPTLAALSIKYSDTEFMGILTRDNPVSAEAFVRKYALPYPTFIDDSLLIGFHGTLTANAIPTTVLIDKDGKVAARISGEVTVASLSNIIEKLQNESVG